MESSLKEKVYYPPPESKGGWRRLSDPEEIRIKAGMDPDKVKAILRYHELVFPGCSAIVVIRHGYLVGEWATFNVLPHTKFHVWSCTKSFTATAFGLLLEDLLHGEFLLEEGQVDLDSPAYSFIPGGHPLTDPCKSKITLRHLLTMTSGIVGESRGIIGVSITGTDCGPFEFALGRCPNKYYALAAKLSAKPGDRWDYSDAAFAHLSLIFNNITRGEIGDFLKERVLDRIGIEDISWDVQGGGKFIGPHTNAHMGIHVTARDLARFGYLMLREGIWEEQQLVPKRWIEMSTRTSQRLNESYGYGWWVNSTTKLLPEMPKDTFAARGYNSNQCYVVPSLDLVVARVGTGPPQWDDANLIGGIVGAVISE